MSLIEKCKLYPHPYDEGAENPLYPVLAAMIVAHGEDALDTLWQVVIANMPAHPSWTDRQDQAIRSWLGKLASLGPKPAMRKLGEVLLNPDADWDSLGDPAANDVVLSVWPASTIASMRTWIINKATLNLKMLATEITTEFPT